MLDAQQRLTKRLQAVEYARLDLVKWPTLGAPLQREYVVQQFAALGVKLGPHDHPQWCGAFAFEKLRRAGIMIPDWEIGKGIIIPAHLHPTPDPLPGDIGYHPHPWGHHVLVTARMGVQGETVRCIEGNTPGITMHDHPLARPDWTWYSIESALDQS